MTTSRFSALSINALLIFEIHHVNGALLLYAIFLSALTFSFAEASKTSIVSYKTINALILSHIPDLNIKVLNLTLWFIRFAVFMNIVCTRIF